MHFRVATAAESPNLGEVADRVFAIDLAGKPAVAAARLGADAGARPVAVPHRTAAAVQPLTRERASWS